MKITGVEALLKAMSSKSKPKVVPNAAQRAVKKHGGLMQKEAMRKVAVDTGTLKRSIEIEILDGGYTAKVAPHTHYAVYQEYGTRYMSGKPYIRPAFYNRIKPFLADLEEIVK
ncbi:MAG: hypothetical protein GX777_01945 [Fastidiosipila sp.]|nr:hypothetical protein [Fastidiosipila sp.]